MAAAHWPEASFISSPRSEKLIHLALMTTPPPWLREILPSSFVVVTTMGVTILLVKTRFSLSWHKINHFSVSLEIVSKSWERQKTSPKHLAAFLSAPYFSLRQQLVSFRALVTSCVISKRELFGSSLSLVFSRSYFSFPSESKSRGCEVLTQLMWQIHARVSRIAINLNRAFWSPTSFLYLSIMCPQLAEV